RKILPFYRRIWRRWAGVVSVLTDTIPNIRVTKSFAGEERTVEKFKSYNKEWLNVDTSAARISTVFPQIVSFFVTCGSLLIWSVGGGWVISGTGGLTTGLLVSFLSYASMFYGPVNFFAYLNDSYQHALSSVEKVFDILDAEDEADEAKGNCPPIRGKIEFKNVNFSFDRTKKVLTDVNITIEPGEIVGIVGTTGSGKSTLVNLLMRFYDNYEGEILVDGENIKNIDLQYFRSQIGYVQQDPMMFSDTVYNNIAYGKPDAHVEEVIHAAEVANAHEFIARQPDGYDTVLGERGVGLSGGERQRVSIARAVLKNPSLLIFDEATAAVDSETEHLIQEAIERLISGRTTLMIAHRLSTLRKANRIIVVDQGRIIENDTPEALMALKGKYYKLVQIQTMADQVAKSKAEEKFE
ncbi:MAG: ABC transporter ATP-binding protein, partial [Clostridia bacterium]|nr:ABC transporter ATP-binding protein [Clostridia bacterium]